MKQVSANYKNQINEMGREIDSIISYYNHYQVITEDNKFILTEDGEKILTEQIKEDSHTDITAEDIYSSKVITHGTLLKTMMKEFDFEVKQDIKIGSIVSYKFGLKVNDSYEYVDYGNFIVNQKEFNEDTKTYSYVAYDKLLFTMIPYVAEDISERQGAYTLYDLVNYCCDFCNLQLGVETFPNGEREITNNTLKLLESSNFTFRDVLDYATEVTGCSSYLIDDSFVIMPPQETNLVLYADSFKDTNVKFNEIFGPINSILFSRSEDTDFIETKDDESIQTNGVTQIKIKDNPFLEGNDRADYFEEMFDVLDGLTYSLNDVSSTGVTYLEFNDKYKVNIDNNEYDCLLLNDEIIVEQGLEENIFTEEPQEKQQEYVTSTANVDDVSLRVDKANKQIVLKVDSEGKLALAELKQNADNGTEFNVKADNIKLEGYTTINGGFAVDLDGNMACNNATINGGKIDLYGPEQTAQFIIHSTDSNGYASLGSHEITMSNGEEHSNGFYADTYDTSGTMWYRFDNSYIQCTFFDNMPQYNDITLLCNGTAGYSTTLTSMSSFTLRPKEIYCDILETDGKFLLSIGQRRIIEASYTGVYLYNGSLEEYKKNIKMFNNALELIKNTDVYSFNYKEEADDYKPHIGVVIGKNKKTPTEMLNNDNDGADYNNMTSICIQAIKEQQEQIELLKQEIESLKERIGK